MKILILCIDALDYNFCMDFRELFEGFNIIKMNSNVPITGSAWTTIYTGVPEKQHGVKTVDGIMDTDESKSFRSCKIPFFWDYLSDKRCELFALPVTYPCREIKGYMVSGDIVPSYEVGFTFPRQLKKNFVNYYIDIWHYLETKGLKFGKKQRGFEIKKYQRRELEKNPDDLYSGLREIYKQINDGIVNNFIQFNKPTDLCALGFTFIDRVLHWSPIHTTKVRVWYVELKKIIDRLLVTLKPPNIIIMSDHGRPTQIENPKHRREGVFMYQGIDLKKSDVKECSQLDFVPTLLKLYDVKKPEICQGDVLDIFKSENDLINEKLEGIGYK